MAYNELAEGRGTLTIYLKSGQVLEVKADNAGHLYNLMHQGQMAGADSFSCVGENSGRATFVKYEGVDGFQFKKEGEL